MKRSVKVFDQVVNNISVSGSNNFSDRSEQTHVEMFKNQIINFPHFPIIKLAMLVSQDL